MNQKEARKALKEVIKGLKKLHNEGAGVLTINASWGSRQVNPGDKEWDENLSAYISHKKHDGHMTITIEIFNPNI